MSEYRRRDAVYADVIRAAMERGEDINREDLAWYRRWLQVHDQRAARAAAAGDAE